METQMFLPRIRDRSSVACVSCHSLVAVSAQDAEAADGRRSAYLVYAAHPRLLPRAWIRQTVPLGALRGCAVHTAREAAGAVAAGVDHDGSAVSAGCR